MREKGEGKKGDSKKDEGKKGKKDEVRRFRGP